MTKPKKFRKFKGKVYEVFDIAFSREETNQEADELRRKGFLARTVPTGHNTWLIYRKKK